MSGIDGGVGELDELLEYMQEARNDQERSSQEKRTKTMEQEAEKDRLGAFIREQAVN